MEFIECGRYVVNKREDYIYRKAFQMFSKNPLTGRSGHGFWQSQKSEGREGVQNSRREF